MEAASINTSKDGITGNGLKNTLLILSCYPYVFSAIVLIGGLLQSRYLTYMALGTLMLYVFFGAIAWIIILVCSLVCNKIVLKYVAWNVIILLSGIIVAYYVVEYDVFSSGAKYMD